MKINLLWLGCILLVSCTECGGTQVLSGPVAVRVERTVEIEPIPGMNTREELEADLAGMVSFVDGEALLASLEKTRQAVERFWQAGRAVTDFSLTNHEVRNTDLLRIAETVLRDHPSPSDPKFYTKHQDDWPQVIAVWRTPIGHKILGLGQGNDNSHLFLKVVKGPFVPEYSYFDGGEKRKPYIAVDSFMARAKQYLEPTSTIYPHIEIYKICPDEC